MQSENEIKDFYLQRLVVENYRCFPRLDISFDEKLTVLVAPNGGGKTAVLDAIATALRLFVDTVEGRATSKGFDTRDIRLALTVDSTMEPVTPVTLAAKGLILNEPLVWIRERQSLNSSRTTTAEATSLKKAALKMSLEHQKWSKIQKLTWGEISSLPIRAPIFPLISYYGTGRLWSSGKFTAQKRVKLSALNARVRGYLDCLSSSSHFKYFIDWFRRFSYESKREGESVHAPQLILSAVSKAVDIALLPSGWHSLEWDFAEDVAVANHSAFGRLPVDFLSDGIRNAIGLVADIAYRMIMLNPHFRENATILTPGVVLIDEVDMHLHPEWQQQILSSLKSAFPKVQFIVTTHSPQVLSTIRKENIRMLLQGVDHWTAEIPEKSPYGRDASNALAEILGTHPRPEIPELLGDLHLLEQLVRSGKGNTSQAQQLLDKLTEAGFEFRDVDLAVFNYLLKKSSSPEEIKDDD